MQPCVFVRACVHVCLCMSLLVCVAVHGCIALQKQLSGVIQTEADLLSPRLLRRLRELIYEHFLSTCIHKSITEKHTLTDFGLALYSVNVTSFYSVLCTNVTCGRALQRLQYMSITQSSYPHTDGHVLMS